MKSLKPLFNRTLAIAAFCMTTLSVYAAEQVLYVVPESISPDGKFGLAAFGDSEDVEDVKFYMVRFDSSTGLKRASSSVIDWGSPELDFRGYGPRTFYWSYNHNESELTPDYLLVQNDSRKSNHHVFLRNINNRWIKQNYDPEVYDKKCVSAANTVAAKKGYEEDTISGGVASYTTVSKKSNPVLESSEEDTLETGAILDFEEPLYMIHECNQIMTGGDLEDTEIQIRVVVKIIKNEDGDLEDSVVGIYHIKNPE